MSDSATPTSRRGLGIVMVVGFGALLVLTLTTPALPSTAPVLASAGILSGLAMCVRSRWTNLIEACAAVLIGVVFVGAGIVGLVTDGTGIVTSLFLAALGVVCLIAAVLRVRAHRSGQRTTDGGAADLSVD